jgi:hypothetical protein
MIRGSDGLDYENLTEKLLGNPAGTRYNARVQKHRASGLPKDEQDLWVAAHNAEFSRLVALDRSEDRDFIDWQASNVANDTLSAHRFARAELTAQDRSRPG